MTWVVLNTVLSLRYLQTSCSIDKSSAMPPFKLNPELELKSEQMEDDIANSLWVVDVVVVDVS